MGWKPGTIGVVWLVGTKTSFTTTSLLLLPRRPRPCQVSRISTSDAGITAKMICGPASVMRGCSPSITIAVSMMKRALETPLANGRRPFSWKPPGTSWAATGGWIAAAVSQLSRSASRLSTVLSGNTE